MKKIYTLCLVLCLGCNSAPRTDLIGIFDHTEAHNMINPAIVMPIFDSLSYGSVAFTEIIDQSFVKEVVIKRPERPSYLLRVESKERKKYAAFKEDLASGLALYNRPSSGLGSSYVYSVLAHSCKNLASLNSSNKQIWVFGDLLHNVPDEFSFYSFLGRPEDILKAHDSISNRLEFFDQDIKNVSLSGISIKVVYFPDKEHDRLYRAVRFFWMKYFEDKGADIEFIAAIDPHYTTMR
ncbi:MAG: hypothetical protein RIC35_02580 [Marinoscillum sp.]